VTEVRRKSVDDPLDALADSRADLCWRCSTG
jgi:hypothetical protein